MAERKYPNIMLLKDLPTKRKAIPIYKVQCFGELTRCWHEFSKAYTIKENAIRSASNLKRGRVIKKFNGKEQIVYEA